MTERIDCPECEALNPADAAFCTACGVKLVAAGAVTATPSASARAGRRRRSGDAVERSRARHEFGRRKGVVLTVRSVYWSGVFFAVVQLLLHYVILARLFFAPDDWLRHVAAAICWGQLGLMVGGALLVLRAPLLWTTIGACYWTLNTALALWTQLETDWVLMQDARAMAFLTMLVLMVVSFWFAVGQAARVQRLMEENPELQIVRRKLDPSRRVEGGVADEARARRQREAKREWRSRLLIAGFVAAGIAVVGVGIWLLTRPVRADATIEQFAARWRDGDVEALAGMFVEGGTGRNADRLREDLTRRGWRATLPTLGEPELEERGDVAVANFAADAGPVQAVFRRESVGWRLAEVALPRLVPDDIAPAVAKFREAWAAEGADPLVARLRPEVRERIGATIVRLLEKRGWLERRPELGDVDLSGSGTPRARATFALDLDDIDVVFEYWHPDWWVAGMRLPRE